MDRKTKFKIEHQHNNIINLQSSDESDVSNMHSDSHEEAKCQKKHDIVLTYRNKLQV